MHRTDPTPSDEGRARVEWLARQLRPGVPRDEALGSLDRMFAAGKAPDGLDGFCRGALVTTSVSGVLDGLVRRGADLWMPWLGKSFASERDWGVNVLTPSARGALRFLWPGYEPVAEDARELQVFSFRTRVGPGELDPGTQVLKIDYDHEENPALVVRRILDELVEIEPGFFLGKALFRSRRRFRRVGFFTLEAEA